MAAAGRPEPMALTEANLRRLQPSFIRPMAPVSVSSGNEGAAKRTAPAAAAAAAAAAALLANSKTSAPAPLAPLPPAPAAASAAERVARLKVWVYNAMQTLESLGAAGQQILAVDELYVVPGTSHIRWRNNQGQPQQQQQQQQLPNLDDPAFWEAKLQYFEAKCRPLNHVQRKRRRLATALLPGLEAEAAGHRQQQQQQQQQPQQPQQPGPGSPLTTEQQQHQVQKRQLEQQLRQVEHEIDEHVRIEQTRLLWRDKRASIERWVHGLPGNYLPLLFCFELRPCGLLRRRLTC